MGLFAVNLLSGKYGLLQWRVGNYQHLLLRSIIASLSSRVDKLWCYHFLRKLTEIVILFFFSTICNCSAATCWGIVIFKTAKELGTWVEGIELAPTVLWISFPIVDL